MEIVARTKVSREHFVSRMLNAHAMAEVAIIEIAAATRGGAMKRVVAKA